MSLIALVIGTSVTVSATERVTASLVVFGIAGWSFVPLLQLLTGLLLVRGSALPRMELLIRYFQLHRPWSLWILAVHAVLLLIPIARHFQQWVVMTLLLPMLWTMGLLLRFCRDELQLEGWRAVRRVALHQSVTYAAVFVYVFVAVALWPRILGLFR